MNAIIMRLLSPISVQVTYVKVFQLNSFRSTRGRVPLIITWYPHHPTIHAWCIHMSSSDVASTS